jgi:ABC-type multidrug transport system ATPase subunit
MFISLHNCGKNYHRTWLFRGLSFNIELGTEENNTNPLRLAILGSNGAGKSTFTLMLAGQTDPTEGTLQWISNNNKAIDSKHWHTQVAVTSPGMELPEEFTLQEWFTFHQKIRGFQSQIGLNTMMDLCGFPKNTATKTLLTFSSGMKQRVKLCSALLGTQPLIILDEPLTNLDAAGNEVYRTLIQEFLLNRNLIVASNRNDEWVPYCNSSYSIGDAQINALQAI